MPTLLVAILISVKLSISSLVSILPTHQLEAWEKSNKNFSSIVALRYIERLKITSSKNPNNLFLQARLYDFLAMNEKNITKQKGYLIQSKKHYLSFSKVKPTCSLSWAKLAFIEDILQNTDEKKLILQRLYLAIELGPYEPKTQKVVIPLIYKYWNYIKTNDKMKNISLDILSHSIKYKINARLVIDNAQKYQLHLINKKNVIYSDD